MLRVLVVLAVAASSTWADSHGDHYDCAPTHCKTYCCDCPETCEGQADVSIAVDISGSNTDAEFAEQQDFVKLLLSKLGVNNQHFWVCLVQFNKTGHVLNDFNSEAARDLSALMGLVNDMDGPGGDTSAGRGLVNVRSGCLPTGRMSDKHEIPDVVVHISDGGSDDKAFMADQAAKLQAKTTNIVAVSLDAAPTANEMDELQTIAGPDGVTLLNANFASMDLLCEEVVWAVCNFARPMCCPPYYILPNPGQRTCLD